MKASPKALRTTLVIVVVLAGCVLAIMFGPGLAWNLFLRDMFFTKPPPSALNPPVYPNGQQVQTVDSGLGSKAIVFETPDKPEAVLAYYREVLHKDGWVDALLPSVPGVAVPSTPLPQGDYPQNTFEWDQAGLDGPTDLAYSLVVNTSVTDQGKTKVEISVIQFDPR